MNIKEEKEKISQKKESKTELIKINQQIEKEIKKLKSLFQSKENEVANLLKIYNELKPPEAETKEQYDILKKEREKKEKDLAHLQELKKIIENEINFSFSKNIEEEEEEEEIKIDNEAKNKLENDLKQLQLEEERLNKELEDLVNQKTKKEQKILELKKKIQEKEAKKKELQDEINNLKKSQGFFKRIIPGSTSKKKETEENLKKRP